MEFPEHVVSAPTVEVRGGAKRFAVHLGMPVEYLGKGPG